MQTKLKRHQRVRLLVNPAEEDTEPFTEPATPIEKGMEGTINIVLPNGRYHVRIPDKKGNELAYVVMDEEYLEPLD